MSDETNTSAGSAEWQSRHDRLEAFLTLTATSLSSLQFRELLLELLQRIREVLEVDTAALFVLDERSRELEAWAAIGIDEEALRSVGVPVGKGFTGRIAQLKQTLVLDKVDVSTVASPALVARGLRAMLGTPLLDEGKLVGVLHVDPCRTGSSARKKPNCWNWPRGAWPVLCGLARWRESKKPPNCSSEA